MPTIVTATELRTILGVSSSLYSDAYLADIVDASENLVLPMLVTFQSKINKVKLENNIAYFETATIQEFTEGQSVIITGCGAPFNGTHTVTDDEISDYVFTVAITNPDILEKNIIPAGNAARKKISSQQETLRYLDYRPMSETPMLKLLFWLSPLKSSNQEPPLVDQSKA